MVLVSHRVSEIEDLHVMTHVLQVGGDNRISACGPKDQVLTESILSSLDHKPQAAKLVKRDALLKQCLNWKKGSPPSDDTLVRMKNVRISFGENVLVDNLDWEIRRGEHWAIQGPNGCGKTQLLGLISGENTQVYKNEVLVFGKSRNTMSLEQVREHLGLVSAKLQAQFQRTHQSALKAICTAFHGVVGGYCPPCTSEQVAHARKWAELLEIDDLLDKNFPALSQGQQRLVLCARAFVCGPAPLLLLDEPFHGLDSRKRALLLTILSEVAKESTVVMVTHHGDEVAPFVVKTLKL
uniref:ABC transporter domain-containing protein n=3 Tax=Mucochytrium quahogii TaxID=96639 RepID=A0A7S2RXA5_9STRA|mmetsp:Transcript_4506/g.7756  ORF Transcript_4506/g.7756 Transcript_4506/m.7756 type:complete len:295 (+) Transcript_4506:797-1681(+)